MENLKRIIRIYSESKESGSNFYTEMLRENSMSKENQGFDRPDDENFAEMVRREIKQLSKKYGIDENIFCFDTDRVQEMQEYDERNKANSNDLEMRNDTQIVNEENNRSSAKANTQSNDDNKIKEEQEIEEILKKVLNLTPENRRKAFQVLEDLENEQSKAERR